MNISNKTLVLLLILTIVFSSASVLLNLDKLQSVRTTSFATNEATGSIVLDLDNFFGITTIDSPSVEFGSCFLPENTDDFFIITSEGTFNTSQSCIYFSISNISVRNWGTIPANVSVDIDVVGAEYDGTFLDSPSGISDIKYKVSNFGVGNLGGCFEDIGPSDYVSFEEPNMSYPVCGNLSSAPKGGANSVVINFLIVIPGDIEMGLATANIRFTGVAIN